MSAKRFLLVLMLVVSFVPAAFASSYSAVVVYGDSLSDNGNLYGLTGGIYPPPPYYNGRRSDGPLAVEYLAASLGVPLVDNAVIGATTGVGNYADGGSTTALGTFNFPGMTTVYDATKSSLGPLLSNSLFVVWGGPNDFLAPSALDTTPADVITRAVTNELSIIAGLQAQGATHILVPGMGDLGLTPDVKSNGQAAADAGTAFTDAFNAALLSVLPTGVLYFDTATLTRAIAANPAAYGLTNVTDACYAGIGSLPCANPQSYFFYDAFHPSTAGDAILAQGFLSVVPVPVPAAVWLFGSALAGLIGLARRKQAAG